MQGLQEKADSFDRPPVVSEESPGVEPSSVSSSTTDEVAASDHPGSSEAHLFTSFEATPAPKVSPKWDLWSARSHSK